MLDRLICLLPLLMVGIDAGFNVLVRRRLHTPDGQLDNSSRNVSNDYELLLAFAMFRHGDRTCDSAEISKFPAANINATIFFPYGLGALTNAGKRHAYNVGDYLRRRYNGFLSELYLPEEISIRTTDIARTKMTVLAALAGLYPPKSIQRWNNYLNWQPIPYDSLSVSEDELQVYKSCPIYPKLKDQVYEVPEIHNKIVENEDFLKSLSEMADYQFKTPTDLYFFHSLIKCLENVGVKVPQWVDDARPKLVEFTNLEFQCEFYSPELIRLGGGVTLEEFINASKAIMAGDKTQPKVHLLSAHENSVAGFMAAATVFNKPHQPNYGATFSLELYKNKITNKYGVMAVYAAQPGGPGEVLPIPDCGGQSLCDFDTFLNITRDYSIPRNEYQEHCISS